MFHQLQQHTTEVVAKLVALLMNCCGKSFHVLNKAVFGCLKAIKLDFHAEGCCREDRYWAACLSTDDMLRLQSMYDRH